jgi:hypothetical protein
MSTFRAMALWLLVLAVPAQSWAAVVMTHCKDMQSEAVHQQAPAPHDHAAMMRQMAEAASADPHGGHHAHRDTSDRGSSAQQSAGAGTDAGNKGLDCECDCDCSGNCAVSCATSALSLSRTMAHSVLDGGTLRPAALRSQALTAYRFPPLRPPSAAAI